MIDELNKLGICLESNGNSIKVYRTSDNKLMTSVAMRDYIRCATYNDLLKIIKYRLKNNIEYTK